MDRVIALVDMDCFYVQVEQRLNPSTKGRPCAVVQYKTWKGGGIIAVGYEARAFGVTRNMWGDEAKAKCSDIHFFRVPEYRGKADLTKYREAGAEVINVLSRFSSCVERASIDEAYIDLTEEVKKRMSKLSQDKVSAARLPNTFVVGWGDEKDAKREDCTDHWLQTIYDNSDFSERDRHLAVGAVISEEMRAAVYEETGFTCSAGIAHNKMLSKLACGFHKPNGQTILPHESVPGLFNSLPVKKIRHLGGKLGQMIVEQLQVENIGDLCKFSLKELQNICGDKTGVWLYDVCRGIEHEPVSARQLAKSIGCSKNFPGKTCLDTREKVKFWLQELSSEVAERLAKDKESNNRTAKSMTVSVRYMSKPSPVVASRACGISKYDATKFATDAFSLLQQFNVVPVHQTAWSPPIICLGISATKFQDASCRNAADIKTFMGKRTSFPLSQDVTNTKSSPTTHTNGNTKTIKSFFLTQMQSPSQCKTTESNTEKRDENASCAKWKDESTEVLDASDLYDSKSSEMDLLNDKPVECISDKESRTKSRKYNDMEISESEKGNEPKKRFFASKRSQVIKTNQKSLHQSGFFDNISKGKQFSSTSNSDSSGHMTGQCNETSPYRNNDLHHKNDSGFYREDDNLETELDENSLDADVLDSLPADIREEVLGQIRRNSTKNSLTVKNISLSFGDVDISPVNDNNTDLKLNIDGDLNKASNYNQDNYLPCQKCGQQMAIWQLQEHMDFHFAQDLQKELTLPSPETNNLSNLKRKIDTNSSQSSNKRKKNEGSLKIDNFFQRK